VQGGGSTAPAADVAVVSPSVMLGIGDRRRNLIIEGRVEAQVALHAHYVSIAPGGSVSADIHASIIHVGGEIEGNLFGIERVVVQRSGTVRGNIFAPEVAVEEGARVAGKIDIRWPMEDQDPRRSIRAQRRLAIEFSSDCPPIQAFVEDLSETGMFIDVDHALPAGSKIDFSLSLPDSDRETPVTGKGVVVWSSPTGMGVEIEEIADADRERIRFFVAAVHFGQPPDLEAS
jgi:cytoskeletal protein CcmA (bactofilin family)